MLRVMTPIWMHTELRRPDLFLGKLSTTHPFDQPRTLLARIDGPYDDQRLTSSTVLWSSPPLDEQDRTRMTEAALKELDTDWTNVPYEELPLVVAVVVRPGACWWSWDEHEVYLGLRYGSNRAGIRQGETITVTGQGWYEQLYDAHGTDPRAQWADWA